MAEKREGEEVEGFWVRGADGGLYFIPQDDLETYRVPDDLAEPAIREIDQLEAPETVGFGKVILQDFHFIPGTGIRSPDIAAAPAIIPPPASLRGLREPGT